MHEQKDYTPGFWLKVRSPRRQCIIGLRDVGSGEIGFFAQHRRQPERAEPKPGCAQPRAAGNRSLNTLI